MTYVSLAQLRTIRQANAGRRLALVVGYFNVLHAGHIRLLKFARSMTDELVVALYPDVARAVPQELRLSAIRSLDMVDQAFVIEDNIRACVEALKPDLIVKGSEHEKLDNPETDWLKPWDGRLVFCTDDPRFSLDDAIQSMLKKRALFPRLAVPQKYMERHQINFDDLARLLDVMAKQRVCVIGDLIVDEYISCNPLGMSREDPTLVVSPVDEKRFIGGAGIVAGHAAGLGGRVNFITVAGNDETARQARKWLDEQDGIRTHLLIDPDRPTTIKQRFRAQNKTLLRVNRMSQQHIGREHQDQMMRVVDEVLPESDLLIFSDFSYGALPPALVDRITDSCRRLAVPIAADSQTSSQVGDLAKFKDALLVTPTELEARHAMRNFTQGLVALIEEMMNTIRAKNVVVTLSEDGCLIYGDPRENHIRTDQLPSLQLHPVDPAGAGDSFLTAASLALTAGGTVWQAALLGSIAAGVQVGRLGNIPIQRSDILANITAMNNGPDGAAGSEKQSW